MKILVVSLLAAVTFAAAAEAQTSYVSCSVQTVFRKPYTHGTDWVHVENQYTKILKIDSSTRMVSFWDNRKRIWKPV